MGIPMRMPEDVDMHTTMLAAGEWDLVMEPGGRGTAAVPVSVVMRRIDMLVRVNT
jgi:hypothetical protein